MEIASWESLLLDRLSGGAVYVIHVVRDQLGREPTSAELTAARRAAHRLAEKGAADIPYAADQPIWLYTTGPRDEPAGRPGRGLFDPPARRGRPRSEVQMARTIVSSAVTAGRTAVQLDVGRIEPEAAAELAVRPARQVLVELGRLEQELTSRST